MMSEEDVKALIVARCQQLNQCNGEFFLIGLKGQIRGLVATITSKPPPLSDNVRDYLNAARIPYKYKKRTGEVDFDDLWLKAHGFEVFDDGEIHHKLWSRPW
jgi:hypothetical protein